MRKCVILLMFKYFSYLNLNWVMIEWLKLKSSSNSVRFPSVPLPKHSFVCLSILRTPQHSNTDFMVLDWGRVELTVCLTNGREGKKHFKVKRKIKKREKGICLVNGVYIIYTILFVLYIIFRYIIYIKVLK